MQQKIKPVLDTNPIKENLTNSKNTNKISLWKLLQKHEEFFYGTLDKYTDSK